MGKHEKFARRLEQSAAAKRLERTKAQAHDQLQGQLRFWQMITGALLNRIPGTKAVISFDEIDRIAGRQKISHECSEKDRHFVVELLPVERP